MSQLAARLVRTLFRICRVEILRGDLVEKYFNQGRPGIGITWHRGAIFSLYFFGNKRPAV